MLGNLLGVVISDATQACMGLIMYVHVPAGMT